MAICLKKLKGLAKVCFVVFLHELLVCVIHMNLLLGEFLLFDVPLIKDIYI